MNITKMGAYTKEKKDVLIILRNEPLMFVQGPPVFIRVVTKHEESTSVFVVNEDAQGLSVETDREENEKQELQGKSQLVKVASPSVIRRINYLALPFPRQVYRPLQFVLDNETITGIIEKIDGETILIGNDDGEKEYVAIEMGSIEEILWRGDPFVES